MVTTGQIHPNLGEKSPHAANHHEETTVLLWVMYWACRDGPVLQSPDESVVEANSSPLGQISEKILEQKVHVPMPEVGLLIVRFRFISMSLSKLCSATRLAVRLVNKPAAIV